MKKRNFLASIAITATLAGCVSSPSLNSDGFNGVAISQKQQCEQLDNTDYMDKHYGKLLEQKWDRHAVGCGALYIYEIASDSTLNIPLKLEALGAQLTYFDVLSHYYPKLYKEGDLNRELNELWRATRVRAEHLIKSVEGYEFLLNEITLLKGAYVLAQSSQDTAVREQVKAAVEAKKLIDKAVENNPESIDGLGLLLSGRLYQDMPSFVGGDIDKGVKTLEQLNELHPKNLETIRWLIQGYEASGKTGKAKMLITEAASIEPTGINEQDYADLLLTLGGMAKRHELNRALLTYKQQRKSLFKKSPYLLSRKQAATLGHGSADPITGKDTHDL